MIALFQCLPTHHYAVNALWRKMVSGLGKSHEQPAQCLPSSGLGTDWWCSTRCIEGRYVVDSWLHSMSVITDQASFWPHHTALGHVAGSDDIVTRKGVHSTAAVLCRCSSAVQGGLLLCRYPGHSGVTRQTRVLCPVRGGEGPIGCRPLGGPFIGKCPRVIPRV
jgi:hypothetical protein